MCILNHLPRPTKGSRVASSAAADLAGRMLCAVGNRCAYSAKDDLIGGG